MPNDKQRLVLELLRWISRNNSIANRIKIIEGKINDNNVGKKDQADPVVQSG